MSQSGKSAGKEGNEAKRSYKCGKCGQPKEGHTCPFMQGKTMEDLPLVKQQQVRAWVVKNKRKKNNSTRGRPKKAYFGSNSHIQDAEAGHMDKLLRRMERVEKRTEIAKNIHGLSKGKSMVKNLTAKRPSGAAVKSRAPRTARKIVMQSGTTQRFKKGDRVLWTGIKQKEWKKEKMYEKFKQQIDAKDTNNNNNVNGELGNSFKKTPGIVRKINNNTISVQWGEKDKGGFRKRINIIHLEKFVKKDTISRREMTALIKARDEAEIKMDKRKKMEKRESSSMIPTRPSHNKSTGPRRKRLARKGKKNKRTKRRKRIKRRKRTKIPKSRRRPKRRKRPKYRRRPKRPKSKHRTR